jgi:hypothetical protein
MTKTTRDRPDINSGDAVLIRVTGPVTFKDRWGGRTYYTSDFCGLVGLVLSVQHRPDFNSFQFNTYDPLWMVEVLVKDEILLMEGTMLTKIE